MGEEPHAAEQPLTPALWGPGAATTEQAQELQLLSPRVTTKEAEAPENPRSAAREATTVRSLPTTREQPRTSQLEKSSIAMKTGYSQK